MKILKSSLITIILLFSIILTGCTSPAVSAREKRRPVIIQSTVSCNSKFDHAVVDLTPEEFESRGFCLGDSCDILFSNGYFLSEVPYYDGFYVKTGMPVIVAYPDNENIMITFNNQGIWTEVGLEEGDHVILRRNQKGEYLDLQETLGQVYSNERKDYDSDEEFCNFRALKGGNLKDNFLFRGASAIDNSKGRARYTDDLLSKNSISFIVDLADSEEDLAEYRQYDDFDSPYALSCYENGCMVLLNMSTSYPSEEYQQKLVKGLREMMNAQGSVYIHCMEGKDRTGFVCMLIEALAGATYSEMKTDYMITYNNYCDVSEEFTSSKYNAIGELYFDAFASYLHGTEDPEELVNADFTEDAEAYLKKGGMTEEELVRLHQFISA